MFEINTVKYIPHSECIKLMQSCDALLTLVGQDNRNNGVLTGKIFEYLRCGIPIISLCPQNGALWKLLENFDRIHKSSPILIEEIENAINNAWIDHKSNNTKVINNSLKPFERNHLTELLAKTMDSCIAVCKK